ncbi:LiaI-LiaF-like domain-containing protein [Candidatus Neomarinimicrobiota bacterium]
MTKYKNNQNSWIGITLIIIGCFFILDTFKIMEFSGIISDWWPAIFIIIGLIKLQGRDRGAGLIFIIIGALLLLIIHDVVEWNSIWRLWPLILIFIGLSMISKGRRNKWKLTNEKTTGDDYIHSNAVFGGSEHAITSQNFRGGETMALFGGVELDMRQAQISADGCKIHATALFGGVEIIVPDDWNVIITGTPIFGGIDSKSRRKSDAKSGKDIYIHCTVAFGAVEIK